MARPISRTAVCKIDSASTVVLMLPEISAAAAPTGRVACFCQQAGVVQSDGDVVGNAHQQGAVGLGVGVQGVTLDR